MPTSRRGPTTTASRSTTTWRRATSPLLAALVACLLAAPAASAACGVALTGACVEITPPAPLALGTLAPGTTTTSEEQSIVISSNQAWGLKIRADRADGRLTEWTGAAYGSRSLLQPLSWGLTSIAGAAQTPSYSPLTGTGATVVTGRPATSCGLSCGTETIGLRFRLPVTFSDVRVAPSSYRIVVTYEAAHGF